MPTDDLSWPLLSQIVRDWSGSDCQLKQVQRLSGGVVSNTALLDLNNGLKVVLKVSPHRVDLKLEREAKQLKLLQELGIPTARVHKHHTGSLASPHSFLILEFVPHPSLSQLRKDVPSPDMGEHFDAELARIAVKLHSQTHDRFGPHESATHENWCVCFRDAFTPIIQEVGQMNVLQPRTFRQVGKIHDRLDRLISTSDRPRLTHGDFWAGNILVDVSSNGSPRVAALIDPTCKFWHAETELAYLDLYSAPSSAFRKTYQETFRLTDSFHRVRKPVYQMYFLLNQLQLHGATTKLLEKLAVAADEVSTFI